MVRKTFKEIPDSSSKDKEPPWDELRTVAHKIAFRLVPRRVLDDICADAVCAVVMVFLSGKQIKDWRAYIAGVVRRLCAKWHKQTKLSKLSPFDGDSHGAVMEEKRYQQFLSWFRGEFVPKLELILTPLQCEALRIFMHTDSLAEAMRELGREWKHIHELFRAICKKAKKIAQGYPPPED